jgi:hypothetical protein
LLLDMADIALRSSLVFPSLFYPAQ